jgi:hypothetical protein
MKTVLLQIVFIKKRWGCGIAYDIEKIFLFVIKPGDLTRKDWDGNPQAVRPSLNEILDTYISNRIDSKYKHLPVKIILCCGGEIKQEVSQGWNQFKKIESNNRGVEIDEWTGEYLSCQIENYFFNENLFPENTQKNLKKTLALLSDNDYDLRNFHSLVEDILFKDNKQSLNLTAKKAVKKIKLIRLCLHLILKWSQDENNLNAACAVAEYALLRVWDYIKTSPFMTHQKIKIEFQHIYFVSNGMLLEYFKKLHPHCSAREGLFGFSSAEQVEYPLGTFDVIGKIALTGLLQFYTYLHTKEQSYLDNSKIISQTLASLITNNPSASTPLYDGHAIDISLGFMLFHFTGLSSEACQWLSRLRFSITNGYIIGSHFPVDSDNHEDLIRLILTKETNKEDHFKLSTLLPILAEWCALFDANEVYDLLKKDVDSIFTQTNLQIWHPDKQSDDTMYKTNASYHSGFSKEIILPNSLPDLLNQINEFNIVDEANMLSCHTNGYTEIGLVASRHYRTPISSFYWRCLSRNNTLNSQSLIE